MRLAAYSLLALCCAVLAGCSTARSRTYLTDMEIEEALRAVPAKELQMQPGDILEIAVSSSEPELAQPFNTVVSTAGLRAVAESAGLKVASEQGSRSYTVDLRGNIEFPVLGTLPVQGLTPSQISRKITGEIISKGYIKDPFVTVNLQNFTFYSLGSGGNAGGNGGQHIVKANSFNILQALSLIGSLDGSSVKIDDLGVIRTVGDERTMYSVNLRTKELFQSPVFYLQQNDIIYMKPKGGRFSNEMNMTMSFIGLGTAISSLVTTYLLLQDKRER